MMALMWKLPNGLTCLELAKRVTARINENKVLGRSAQLAYYFLLALFPLLLVLTTLLGFLAGTGTKLRDNLLAYLGAVMPASASQLIHITVDEISLAAGGGKLSIGILATLWAASSGLNAIRDSLNFANNVNESRPWWKTRSVSIVLTIAIAILIITALVLMFFGGAIGENVTARYGFGAAFAFTWHVLQWPLALSFVLFAFSLIYYFAPDVPSKRWRWITPGSLFGIVIWLIASFAFRGYLHFSNSYSATYGSLGAVIIMMLWFYFSGAAILIGGEIDCVLERAAAKPDLNEVS